MSLEEIEKELYYSSNQKEKKKTSPKPKLPKPYLPKAGKIAAKTNWDEGEGGGEEENTASFLAGKLPWVLGACILVVLVAGIFIITRYNGASSDISIDIVSSEEVKKGIPFEVIIDINNGGDNLLRESSLSLSNTPGLVNLELSGGQNALTEDAGDLGAGSLSKKTFKFLAVGDIGSVQKINLVFSYELSGGNRFEVRRAREVLIKEPAVKLEVQKPERILGGSAFDLRVDYENISDFDLPDVILEVKYPSAFKFISSSLPPDSLNNYWRLGELKARSKGDILIKGVLEGNDQSVFGVPVVLSVSFLGKNFPVSELVSDLSISASPIKIQGLVNRRTDYVSKLGDSLNYTIQYENNSGIALADVIVKASLVGEMFDFGTLRTKGSINSITNTVTWNAANHEPLRLLDPGASGEVSFDIVLKNQFPIQRLNDRNFTLKVSAEIDSPSVPYYIAAEKTKAITNIETKVSGLTLLDAQAFYRDAESGILNLGPFPPKVNQPTEYTIHWIIRNYSTDVKDIEIRSNLQSGVIWTGIVKSNIDSVPLYNDRTQEIVWAIDRIAATKGILGEPVQAIFQVRATPNAGQLGAFVPLLSETVLRAVDDFTGVNLSNTDSGLSTNLTDDKTVSAESGRVTQ